MHLRSRQLRLFKVAVSHPHSICHMSETQDRHAPFAREGVKGCGLHLYSQYAFGTRRLNGLGRLAEWGISCLACTNESSQLRVFQGIGR